MTHALTSCRRVHLVESEADLLVPEAFAAAHEGLEIADRCEYRLQQADLHNMLAQLYIADNNPREARKHAEIAFERATCDGPPDYTYKSAYEQAQNLLRQLKA